MVNNPPGAQSSSRVRAVLGKLVEAERELRASLHVKHPHTAHVLEAQSFVRQAIACLNQLFPNSEQERAEADD